jgi:hypothetical protein
MPLPELKYPHAINISTLKVFTLSMIMNWNPLSNGINLLVLIAIRSIPLIYKKIPDYCPRSSYPTIFNQLTTTLRGNQVGRWSWITQEVGLISILYWIYKIPHWFWKLKNIWMIIIFFLTGWGMNCIFSTWLSHRTHLMFETTDETQCDNRVAPLCRSLTGLSYEHAEIGLRVHPLFFLFRRPEPTYYISDSIGRFGKKKYCRRFYRLGLDTRHFYVITRGTH